MGESSPGFSSNMRTLIIICVLGFASAEKDPFEAFAKENGKVYQTRAELTMRKAIFQANYDQMLAHNARFAAGEETWWRKVTPYYDWTREEFTAAFASGLPAYDNSTGNVDIIHPDYADMLKKRSGESTPDSWNWVDQGGVSSVKSQGQCGSCADFAVVSIIESCFWIQRGEMYDDLSEQHLLDCAYNHYYEDDEGSWGAFGCDGAWPQAYMDCVANNNNGKIQIETAYPYEAVEGDCRPDSSGDFTNGQVLGLYSKWDTNEKDMKELVYINPVTTSIQASYMGDYAGGVYNDPRCCEQINDPECKNNLNHEVGSLEYTAAYCIGS